MSGWTSYCLIILTIGLVLSNRRINKLDKDQKELRGMLDRALSILYDITRPEE